ncbi:MAG: hypothetical protein J6D03_08910, partial [Clostridia bacterium]|nr:hypothetical protein [Clostridia bacterium]
NKKDKKLIKIIISIIIILILLLILVMTKLRNMKVQEYKELERIKSYTTIDDFKTVEEVAKYLECSYIKQEKSKVENYNLDFYIKIKLLPYTDNNSNEVFYNKLISYSAKVLKYDNFRIIDRENNIIIEVVCDKEKENIKTIIINGESNYFAKRDSEIQMNNFRQAKETNIIIQSDILTKLINSNWRLKESDIGTKESTFNSYDIFFDEGIEVRKIDNKILNIVFTDKYKFNVVNNISTNTSKQDIIKILGEPTFEDEQTGVIGYKGKEIYCFFNCKNHNISIYKTEDKFYFDEVQPILDNYKNSNNMEKLVSEFQKLWSQYELNDTYLRYSNKGIEIIYNKGLIYIYSNCLDNITLEQINKYDFIIVKNDDLINKTELERNIFLEQIFYISNMNENENSKKNETTQFILYCQLNNELYTNVKFVSKNNNYPNSELRDNINSYVWINESIILYSVKQRGIYGYNAQNGKYVTIIEGKEEYNIKSYKNGILEYDNKQIKI